MHAPRPGTFANGLKSMIVVTGCEQDITRGVGSATSVDGVEDLGLECGS
jgi:hypothetical protein